MGLRWSCQKGRFGSWFACRNALRGRRSLRDVYTRFASLLPMVGTGFCLRPAGAPREAITHHEVVAARVGRFSF